MSSECELKIRMQFSKISWRACPRLVKIRSELTLVDNCARIERKLLTVYKQSLREAYYTNRSIKMLLFIWFEPKMSPDRQLGVPL